jgi:hypothetical protein
MDAVVTALEKRFWDAHIDANPSFFEEFLADECVVIAGFGFADKKTVIASVALRHLRFAAYTMHEVRVTPLGVDSVAVTYRCVIQAAVEGRAHTIVVNVTTVYAKRDGEWRMLLHQQTPAAQ